ncbi:MAG: hypothetical protein AAFN42_00005, partial [Cyanobacteria bacterium J06554_1]
SEALPTLNTRGRKPEQNLAESLLSIPCSKPITLSSSCLVESVILQLMLWCFNDGLDMKFNKFRHAFNR